MTLARFTDVRWLARAAGREMTAADLKPEYLAMAAQASHLSAMQLSDSYAAIERQMLPVHDWWTDGHDLLVTPALRQPPWLLG